MTASAAPPRTVREKLYDIVRAETGFQATARSALELGTEYLGTENGHLTRIDRATDHWETIVSTDPEDGQFAEGLEHDLRETYCRRTIAADGPITLHDAPNQGWADDPALQAHGLRCYYGSTLVLDDEPYGTVCFVSNDRRPEPFSDDEQVFVELLTKLLERELERTQYEVQLERQSTLVDVLNRVLRHNLRNDMMVVRGRIQAMAEEPETDPHREVATETIDSLVELSQKARDLERIVDRDFERSERDVVTVVDRAITRVVEEAPDGSVTVESPTSLTAPLLASFERALVELIENAVVHGGESPRVTVTVENVPNAVEVRIADDGPGLPEVEQRVLQTGVEKPLVHGDGLGLWLAHQIVASHGGTITASVTAAGTEMTVTVPRVPRPGDGHPVAGQVPANSAESR